MGKSVKNPSGAAKGRSKHRSPNYPLFDLEKAVERTKQLYDIDKVHRVPIGIVHDRWGYKRHSGAGNQAVAALKAYGLATVDGQGEDRKVAVSEAGRRIVLGAVDRGELLKEAAVSPSLFNALWEKYREAGLPSDDVLRHHLVFDRNFNEDFVGDVIERFRNTVTFSGLAPGDKIDGGGGDADEQDDGPAEEINDDDPPPRKGRRQVMSGQKEDVYSLDEGPVVLQWPEKISKTSAQDLADWLALIIRKAKRSAEACEESTQEE